MHYCDHNATTPIRPEAASAVERALASAGNPSSVHAAGRAARAVVEDSRRKVALLVGARVEDVIFTSGGSEANALAIHGAIDGALAAEARLTRLFVSAIEHDSVLANAQAAADRVAGLRCEILPVTADGTIDLDGLRAALREGKGRALVAVMAANNETGVIQPLSDVTALVHEAGALLLVDAVQATGKIAVTVGDADYVSLSAHKMGGPQGTGALVVRESAPFAPQIRGGGQERGRRAGTENVPGIAGFGAAAAIAAKNPANAELRDRFENILKRQAPEVVIFGANAERLPNTSNFALQGIASENAVMALDLDGVQISSGSACSSGKVKPSHVLQAMGVTPELAACALRVSFGWSSTEVDVEAAANSLLKLRSRIRARAA